jgi:hypothetical protein
MVRIHLPQGTIFQVIGRGGHPPIPQRKGTADLTRMYKGRPLLLQHISLPLASCPCFPAQYLDVFHTATRHVPPRSINRDREFADSPLEGSGFELLVPRAMQERRRAIIAGFGWKPPSLDYRRLLSTDITRVGPSESRNRSLIARRTGNFRIHIPPAAGLSSSPWRPAREAAAGFAPEASRFLHCDSPSCWAWQVIATTSNAEKAALGRYRIGT